MTITPTPAADSPPTLPIYCELPWNLHKGHSPEFAPDYGHAWWRRRGVVPILKAALPWHDNSAIDVIAEDVADAVVHFASMIGADPMTCRWALMPAYVGRASTARNEIPLFDHPDDETDGKWAPWCRAGIAANRAWMLEFAECLKASLLHRLISTPELLVISSESGPGDIYPDWTDEGIPAWADAAQRDWRADADDHAVKPGVTFRDYLRLLAPANATLPRLAFKNAFGLPPARNPTNWIAREQWEGIRRVAWDYSRVEGIVKPWQRFFPGVPAVEFQAASDGGLDAGIVPALPQRFGQNKSSVGLFGMRGHFRTPLQGPVWYGEIGEYKNNQELTDRRAMGEYWPTEENWCQKFSQAYDLVGRSQIGMSLAEYTGVALALARFRAHAKANPAPLCPWLSLSRGMTDRQAVEVMTWLRIAQRAERIHGVCLWEEGHHWSAAKCDRWMGIAENIEEVAG